MNQRRWYREIYLHSHHWKITRQMAFINAGKMCSHCNSKRQIQCHHLTYVRLGKEPLSDLMVLCARCHRKAERVKFKGDTKTIRDLTHKWLSWKRGVKEFALKMNINYE